MQIRSQPEPWPEPAWKIWLYSPRADEHQMSRSMRRLGLPGLRDERHLLRDTATPMLTRERLSAPSKAPDGVIALVFNSERQAWEAMPSVADRAAEVLGVEDLQLLLTHEYRVV
ncbi:hypothetical protein [Streptomyces sp. MBT62]|uniref:hypothetical protein n=1 Tax=Streptomyces sp. MBT62 TaxID=2800410 RepID=UPI00190DA55F|nr:hypothetical protein [Streptomyces sp. MBT62]MBK3566289.1 hypothetical protein [Streptomyces sp. MBT62]